VDRRLSAQIQGSCGICHNACFWHICDEGLPISDVRFPVISATGPGGGDPGGAPKLDSA
jgi:hypothetical protein